MSNITTKYIINVYGCGYGGTYTDSYFTGRWKTEKKIGKNIRVYFEMFRKKSIHSEPKYKSFLGFNIETKKSEFIRNEIDKESTVWIDSNNITIIDEEIFNCNKPIVESK